MSDNVSAEDIRQDYLKQLKERVDRGEKLTPDELTFLSTVENPADPFPQELTITRKPYTVSPAALKQRQDASASGRGTQTGPNTSAGKQNSSRNAHKHGIYAQSLQSLFKPCFSTCPEYPCSLVEEGQTSPGNHCLDKQHFVEACIAIEKSLKDNQNDPFLDLATIELATNLDIVRKLKEDILTIGTVVKSAKHTKDGDFICYEYKLNPALLALPKLLGDLGLTFSEFLMTPRSKARANVEGKASKTLSDIFQAVGGKLLLEPKDKGGSK